MKYWISATCLVAAILAEAPARANPEPTAYDTRSVSMGLTGTTYNERASALVLNPANLEGIDKLGLVINFTAIFTRQIAPVQGPNTRGIAGPGFGPLPSGFIAGRIAPRVVFAGGVYIETGYGSSFDNVVCLDGAVVGPPPDYTPDTDPATCTNNQPENLDVTFFVGEFSAGTSIRVLDNLWLGVALRLPFSKQVADLYQNVGAALGLVAYGRVKNDLGGVGFPSPRFGVTYKPHRKVTLGAMYRMYSKIKLTGTTESEFITAITGDEFLNASADWFLPHALQFGVAYQANERLLLVWELRLQFHGAPRTGNRSQTVVASSPTSDFETTINVPFGWKNVWSAKAGVEYRFKRNDMLAFRGGLNIAESAATPEWAQYFTPPPGVSASFMAGLGLYWDGDGVKDKYMLDIGTLFAYSGTDIGFEFIGTEANPPGGAPDELVTICSNEQVVRTGCPGQIGVFTYWASVSFALQY